MDLAENLRRSPLFESFGEAELQTLVAALEVQHVPDGKVVVAEGRRGDACYFILEGKIRVTHEVEGRTALISTLRRGEVFGLVALIDHGARSASCSADGPATLAILREGAFTLLHEGSPRLVLHFQKMVARQLAKDARTLNEVLVRAMLAGSATEPAGGRRLSTEFRLSSS